MKIPRSFTIGCHLWTVKVVSKSEMEALAKEYMGDDEDAPFGMNIVATCEVFVRGDACETVQWHSFWHEFVHVLLGSAGLSKINDDEDKVDLLALLIAQAQQTMK